MQYFHKNPKHTMDWLGNISIFFFFLNLSFDIASWISFISNTFRWKKKAFVISGRLWAGLKIWSFFNLPFDIASWISFISNAFRWNNKLLDPLVSTWEGDFLLGWKLKFPCESVLWIDFSTKKVRLHNTLINLHNRVCYDIIIFS